MLNVHLIYQESHQYWMSHEFYYACALMFLFSVSHIVVVSTQKILHDTVNGLNPGVSVVCMV